MDNEFNPAELFMNYVRELDKERDHWKRSFENVDEIAGKLQRKVEALEKEIEHLRTIEQAYEAMKKAM